MKPLALIAAILLTATSAESFAQAPSPQNEFQPVRTADGSVRASAGYLQRDRWETALTISQSVAESGAHRWHRAAAENNSCIALSELGQHTDAVDACARAVDLNPDDGRYAHNLRVAADRAAYAGLQAED